MKILGIDVGLAIVGFGLVEKQGNKFIHIQHGVITTPKEDSVSKRLSKIYSDLKTLIDLYQPDMVGVEQLFYHRNATTVITVSEARGVILLALYDKNIPLVEVTPLQVKQAISAYGRADKKQVQSMVKLLLKLNDVPKPDDAADALAIAICAAQIFPYDLTRKK
jgi:crossover junction endodeoxyribonuclease RuvC